MYKATDGCPVRGPWNMCAGSGRRRVTDHLWKLINDRALLRVRNAFISVRCFRWCSSR